MLALELRLESRYRLHLLAGVLAVSWTAILLVVPPPAARVLTPFVLFLDSATVGVFLLAGMVLLERSERVLAAVLTTPLRTGEYVTAKVTALTGLALAIAVPVAAAGARGDLRWLPALGGVAATAVLLLLLCVALVARHRTITSFLTVAPWPMVPLMAVPLARLAGLADHPLAAVVPTVPAADLIASGFDPGIDVSAVALVLLGAWIAGAGVVAVRRFTAVVRAMGG